MCMVAVHEARGCESEPHTISHVSSKIARGGCNTQVSLSKSRAHSCESRVNLWEPVGFSHVRAKPASVSYCCAVFYCF